MSESSDCDNLSEASAKRSFSSKHSLMAAADVKSLSMSKRKWPKGKRRIPKPRLLLILLGTGERHKGVRSERRMWVRQSRLTDKE